LNVVNFVPPPEPEAWLALRWVLGFGLVFSSLVWQLFFRHSKPAGGTGLMRLQGLSKPLHAAVFTGPPLLLILLLDRLHPPGLPWLALSGVYLFYLGAAVLLARALHQRLDAMFDRGEHEDIAREINDERGFWDAMARLFPLPLAQRRFAPEELARRYRAAQEAQAHQQRIAPRACPYCGQPGMRLLSDTEKVAFLSRMEQIEESLGAMEHDVWLCGACGRHRSLAFKPAGSFYSLCPDCQGMTRELVDVKVRYEATATMGGSGVCHYRCKVCKKRSKESYSLDRLAPSNTSSSSGGSSSSSSSSSSSGSGWGGGNSGGGGSSSSW
jgi:uncharacterized protein